MADTERKWLTPCPKNKMADIGTKWRTQKQNGGHRSKMVDTKTKWRTQKQNGGHRHKMRGHRKKMAETERKWLKQKKIADPVPQKQNG
jgi:hypothetical protein